MDDRAIQSRNISLTQCQTTECPQPVRQEGIVQCGGTKTYQNLVTLS